MPHIAASAASIRKMARIYQTTAAELLAESNRVNGQMKSMEWRGGAADRARVRQASRARRARRLAGELAELSRLLARHAVEVERTQQDLQRLEARIRAWATANPPDPSHPFADASLVTWWPPRHHTGWYDLDRLLRSRGAVF